MFQAKIDDGMSQGNIDKLYRNASNVTSIMDQLMDEKCGSMSNETGHTFVAHVQACSFWMEGVLLFGTGKHNKFALI